MSLAELVYEGVKGLPEPLAREVLDFVMFLRDRDDRESLRNISAAQSVALNAVWDNPEDRVWDEL